MIVTILVFILVLSVLVLIHEFGHFFVAKKFGIKVEEFGFGLPPRIFGKKIGETIYSINWLPIGGFVKLYGEDEAGGGKITIGGKGKGKSVKDKERAFFARSPWQRALVIVAGVAMNFLLSIVIISYIFGVAGVQMPGDKVIITDTIKGAPAEQAGIKKGDIVEFVNGARVTSASQLISITKEHLGEKIELRVKDKELGIKVIKITPRKNYPQNQGPMGVAISQNIITKKYAWYEAPIVGTTETLKNSWLIVTSLGKSAFDFFTHGEVPKGMAGPVGIAQLTGQFVQIGPLAVLSLVAVLSLNLAILNVLPIPALDGGRLFFILIEGLTGKKVSQKFESRAHAVGMVVLLSLIVLITLNDLIKLFTGQPIIPKP